MSQPLQPLTFEAVYAEHGDRIYRYCYRLCNGDAAAAEDVAQETWMRVLRSLHRLQSPVALEGWLFTIARREWLRTRRPPLKTTVMSQLPGTEEIPDYAAAPRIDHLAIRLCLARLAQPMREALVLVKMEGFTHQEAAAILRRPQGTVQYQVAEGLKRLRKMLVEDGRLASSAPLGLLEGELRSWGHVTVPPTLWARIDAARARTGGARPIPGLPAPNSSATPAPAGGALPPAVRSTRSWRWMVAAALLLPAAVIPFSRRRAPVPPPGPDDSERVLATVAGIRSLHAVGLHEEFNLTRWGYRRARNRQLEFWYEPPDRVRMEDRTSDVPTTTIQVTEGGRLRLRVLDQRTRKIHAYPDSPALARVPLALSFLDPGSRLARALRSQRGRIPVQAVQTAGRELRRLRAADAFGDAVRRWELTVDPASGRVVQARVEITVTGSLGVYVQDRITLSEVSYDVPVPASLFNLPDGEPAVARKGEVR